VHKTIFSAHGADHEINYWGTIFCRDILVPRETVFVTDINLIVEVFAFVSLGIVLLSTFTFVLSTLEEFQVTLEKYLCGERSSVILLSLFQKKISREQF